MAFNLIFLFYIFQKSMAVVQQFRRFSTLVLKTQRYLFRNGLQINLLPAVTWNLSKPLFTSSVNFKKNNDKSKTPVIKSKNKNITDESKPLVNEIWIKTSNSIADGNCNLVLTNIQAIYNTLARVNWQNMTPVRYCKIEMVLKMTNHSYNS